MATVVLLAAGLAVGSAALRPKADSHSSGHTGSKRAEVHGQRTGTAAAAAPPQGRKAQHDGSHSEGGRNGGKAKILHGKSGGPGSHDDSGMNSTAPRAPINQHVVDKGHRLMCLFVLRFRLWAPGLLALKHSADLENSSMGR
jgi:hypothetical protein